MNYASLPPTFRDIVSPTDWPAIIQLTIGIITAILAISAAACLVAIVFPRVRARIRKRTLMIKPVHRFFFAIGFSRETPSNQS